VVCVVVEILKEEFFHCGMYSFPLLYHNYITLARVCQYLF
jgi:hypothetical protein